MTEGDIYLPSLEDFENGRIDPDRFDHAAHIYVGWQFTGAWPLPDAIGRFTRALRRLTVQIGAPDKYHETITWWFLLVIADRRAQTGDDWEAFRARNADLFGDAADILGRYYSPELLASTTARERFVLPDRSAGKAA